MRTFRLVHIGMAAAIAASTMTAIGLVQSVGATGSGSASTFVPITPCRLLDTRAGSDNVGTRSGSIGAGEAASFQVTGTNGNCTIPADATGIAANATAVNPTASSYVTIYPADADPRPTASNLNFVAGAAPTPNQVTVGLSTTGAIDIYNLFGDVDLIVDIVGYYQAATVPPTGATCPAAGCQINFGPSLAQQQHPVNFGIDYNTGCMHVEPAGSATLSLPLPYGARISAITISYIDNDPDTLATNYSLNPHDLTTHTRTTTPALIPTRDDDQPISLVSGTRLAPVSSTLQYSIFINVSSTADNNQFFCGAEVTYSF